MKIFAVSDIHVDYEANMQWVKNLATKDFSKDILIIAGDISCQLKLVEEAFTILKTCFKEVFFVPGNHDIWLETGIRSPIEKWNRLYHLAEKTGVCMQARDFNGFSIVPIMSWYDFSFGMPCEELVKVWRDFNMCGLKNYKQIEEINQYCKSKNTQNTFCKANRIITFSHFVPDVRLLYASKLSGLSLLNPVMGSNYMKEYIKEYHSSLHIYGHAHINAETEFEQVVYVNNALGYPTETLLTKKKLNCVYEQEM